MYLFDIYNKSRRGGGTCPLLIHIQLSKRAVKFKLKVFPFSTIWVYISLGAKSFLPHTEAYKGPINSSFTWFDITYIYIYIGRLCFNWRGYSYILVDSQSDILISGAFETETVVHVDAMVCLLAFIIWSSSSFQNVTQIHVGVSSVATVIMYFPMFFLFPPILSTVYVHNIAMCTLRIKLVQNIAYIGPHIKLEPIFMIVSEWCS